MMTHHRMFSLFPSNVIISGQFNLNTGRRVISEDLPPVIILCKKIEPISFPSTNIEMNFYWFA